MVTATFVQQGPLEGVLRFSSGAKAKRCLVWCCACSNEPKDYLGEEVRPGVWKPDEEDSPFGTTGFDVYMPPPQFFKGEYFHDAEPDHYWWDWVGDSDKHWEMRDDLPELTPGEFHSWLASVQRLHRVFRALGELYDEVHVGGLSQGGSLALSAAMYSPVPLAGVLSVCGTVIVLQSGPGLPAVPETPVDEVGPLAPRVLGQGVEQNLQILMTYQGSVDQLTPYPVAVAGHRRVLEAKRLRPKVAIMHSIPAFMPMGPHGHDPGAPLLFTMIRAYYEDAHKASQRKTRKWELLEIPEIPKPKKRGPPKSAKNPRTTKAKAATVAKVARGQGIEKARAATVPSSQRFRAVKGVKAKA